MIKKILPLLIICCAFFSGYASAQWKSDSTTNTLVCNALNSQQNLQSCTDEANGIIIVWEDYRNSSTDIYAQKLDANGVAQWAANGINITNSTWAQTAPVVCSDGSGGAYVAWKDARTPTNGIDLYAQHVASDGSLGYGTSGTPIAAAKDAANPDNLTICPDGSGNAFVAWEDSRTSITASTRPNIWMNKLTPGGAVWGAFGSGSEIINQSLHQTSPRLVDDGSGGCYLVWVNSTLPSSIWASRIGSNGSVLWGSGSGIQVFQGSSGSSDASRNPRVTRDGSQLCVAWEQLNSNNSSKGWNLLANRIKSDGTFVWGTNTVGSEISADWAGDQINGVIFPDDSVADTGVGGLLVVYQTYSSTNSIVLTRLMPDGASLKPAFPNHLFTVCRQNNDQTLPKAVKTGSGELLIVWNDTRTAGGGNTYSSIYAQRCDRTPKRFLGPSPATSTVGIPVSNRVGTNADEVTLVPRTNGGIAAWRDSRNGNFDIYAQLIFRDGSLPVELSNFSVSAHSDSRVLVSWQTASEKDNDGFEVERRFISDPNAPNTFEVVGSYLRSPSLRGAGASNMKREYSFLDQTPNPGIYEYRLVDIALDGERTTHEAKRVEVTNNGGASGWSVSPCSPNPFSERTMLGFSLAQESLVSVEILDVLGRVVANPYKNQIMSSGAHELAITSSMLETSAPSGTYYCIITAQNPSSGEILWKSPNAMKMNYLRQ